MRVPAKDDSMIKARNPKMTGFFLNEKDPIELADRPDIPILSIGYSFDIRSSGGSNVKDTMCYKFISK